jgi:hypothetical protein
MKKDVILKNFIPKYKNGYNLKNMLKRYEINNQSVVLSKDVFTRFNEKIIIGEDYNLFMNILSKHQVCSLKEELVYYRIHSSSITNIKKRVSDGVLVTLKELNNNYKIFYKYPIYSLLTYVKAVRFKFVNK